MLKFDEVVDSTEKLREVIPRDCGVAEHKEIDHIDEICRRYIALSPFALIATRGGDGLLDISPKGDPCGFVKVLDRRTLAIPDRPGNNRLDTLENILAHPEMAMIFLIPGKGDTLRVSGRGRIVRDAALAEVLAVNGRKPSLILIMDVLQAFTHCTKCMVRSGLWKPDRWPDLSDAPSLADSVIAHATPDLSVDDVQTIIDDDRRDNLY